MLKNITLMAFLWLLLVLAIILASNSANRVGGWCDYQDVHRGNINNILCTK